MQIGIAVTLIAYIEVPDELGSTVSGDWNPDGAIDDWLEVNDKWPSRTDMEVFTVDYYRYDE